MKIAVINFSGNVGKSITAQHLLRPRMENAKVISVESINADDGTQDETMRGKQFGKLQEMLLVTSESTVVDIGASNVEDLMGLMQTYEGSHEDFDYFVIPTVPRNKQMHDTISTIEGLSELGVPASKIRLIFNMMEIDEDPEQVFSGLYKYYKDTKKFTLRPGAILTVNEIYGKLKGLEQGLTEILNDQTDYKEQIKTAKDAEEKQFYAQMIGIKRLAAGVVKEHDACFKALFGK